MISWGFDGCHVQLLFSCYLCRSAGKDLPDVEIDLEGIDPNLMVRREFALLFVL